MILFTLTCQMYLLSELGENGGGSIMLIQGHENKYSIYVHASKKSPVHTSSYFVGRDIHSHKVIEFLLHL